MPARGPILGSADLIVDELVRKAAVVGSFDPLELVADGLPPAAAADVLSRLGRVSEEVTGEAGLRWRLTDDSRRAVLATLKTPQQAERLVAAMPAKAADVFGRALQDALLGRSGTDLGANDAVYAARHFAGAAPCARRRREADPLPVRIEIVARRRVERGQVVLPGRLYGRNGEKRAIEAYLRGERLPRRWETGGSGDGLHSRALLVTGVGGVGKSALMTAIVRDARHRGHVPPIITIDFDRPGLIRADLIEILREITRQLGEAVPELERPLAKARDRAGQAGEEGVRAPAALLLETVALDALKGAFESLPKSQPTGNRPAGFAIVLDTFEEVSTRGKEEVVRVLKWLRAMEIHGLSPLRVLVSGRAKPDMPADLYRRWFAGHIPLQGLAPEVGAALLRDNNQTAKLFGGKRGLDAARLFHGHPLALKFLQRYAAEHGEDELDTLLYDPGNELGFPPDFAQVFLFTRILGRIRDPDVRQLAHPGLALRRATPTLIREVLAGPCGFGEIDDTKAESLFDRLRLTTWIVEQDGGAEVVRHRRDLRQLMLPAMMNPKAGDAIAERLREQALRIHADAAAWYGRGADPVLAREAQEVEALYHGACAGEDLAQDMGRVRRLAPQLGQDVADLPVAARALVKVATEQFSRITDAELAALPPEHWERVFSMRETVSLSRGDTAKVRRRTRQLPASDQVAAAPLAVMVTVIGASATGASSQTSVGVEKNFEPPSSFGEAQRRFGRELDALWIEGDFAAVTEVGELAFRRLWQDGSQEGFIETKEDPVHLAVWKYLLALLVAGRWPEPLAGPDAAGHLHRIYPPRLITGDVLLPWTLHNAAIALAWRAKPFAFPESGKATPLRGGWEHVPDQLVRARVQTEFGARTAALGTALAGALGQGVREPEFSGRTLRLYAPALYRNLIKIGLESADGASQNDGRPVIWLRSSEKREAKSEVLRSLRKMAKTLSRRRGRVSLAAITDLNLLMPDLGIAFPAGSGLAAGQVSFRFSEIYGPVLHLLQTLRLGAELLPRLALDRDASIWPYDLARLADHGQEADRLYATLIEMADLNGMLGNLLDNIAAIAPDLAPLRSVRALLDRLEANFSAPVFPST